MAAAYPEVEAPASVKAALDRRLFSGGSAAERRGAEAGRPGFWSSLAFWRALAIAALAALAVYVAMPYVSPPTEAPQLRLVASLAAEGSDVHYLAVYDAAEGEVALSHVSGDRAAGRDFELWMIEGGNAPVSMGIIPAGAATHLIVRAGRQRKAWVRCGARRQPRADGRLADRPADGAGGRRRRPEGNLTPEEEVPTSHGNQIALPVFAGRLFCCQFKIYSFYYFFQ